ncbi:hypothetical protein QJS04_geneDACA005831 [Acorus gramineus]|uniref:Uncharacterized protein n=1 Tax=Acorus gramineus TaxID=55184 RepID=A0AAV9B5B6_ACOGR|nr:hypothetical protein QJS04_geneDACA005831 [Acorus gramineus]
MADHNPFYPYKKLGCNVKSRDASECASTTGPLEECREPMKMWEEIKRNGFLSTPHGGVPTPKQWETLRRNKNGAPKKKAKNGMHEQTKKLMNIAAPSGLLAGLNPGIIYHVRNMKQVRSIIDNVVTSERLDEADPLALKLSSAVNTVSEDTNCSSKEEFSGNHDNISSLSVKAATIACRWLSLIHQDIRGRLAALRRSRKRVRNTIQRDLPVIFSKGFSSNQENGPQFSQPQSATSDIAENRLSQVKEMQLHCERGLQYVSPTAFPQSNPLDNSRPTKAEIIEKEFAVCAAAASIYSTSNLVMTNENMSCL